MNGAMAKSKCPPRELPSAAGAPANDLERRRELGQFFTSPEVAAFIWDLLEVIHGQRFAPQTRLIDPACGEAVFLRVAHERGGLAAKNLFGSDIDESLLSVWQADPLLRGANVHLSNGLLDDPATGIEAGAFHIAAGNPPFSGKGLRDLLRLLAETEAARHEEQDLFETACLKEEPHPARQPLSRRERAELERLVRTLSQYSCWRLEAESEAAPEAEDEAQTESAPGELFATGEFNDRRRPTPSDFEQAARLLAQWPPNRPLDISRPEIRDTVRRLAGTAIEVMFTERFVRLARPGGLIAIIVPESIVASDRLASFRTWLLGRMDLLASISLPQKVFTGVGANAKTSIIFARRREQDRSNGWCSPEALEKMPEDEHPIFLAAPRLDAPGFTVESYLARVLEDARRERKTFWPQEK
jgi:hypothetical protein